MQALTAFSFALRKRLPNPVRQALRLGWLLVTDRPASVHLPPELLEDCRVCASRHAMLDRLPKDGVVAEVGTLHGDFARAILDQCRPTRLEIIDLSFGGLRSDVRDDPRVRLHEGLSAPSIASFPDATFDWIYVDAGHGYADVKADAEAAAPKVKPGGYLVFNDFAHIDPQLGSYGVHRAVTEFALTARWPFAFWAYQPNGLYDVALRKPG